MTKAEFIANIVAMYRVGNASDSDSPEREDWTHPTMSGASCCAILDDMITQLRSVNVLTGEDVGQIYSQI